MQIHIQDFPISLKIGHFQTERAFVRSVFVSLVLESSHPGPENHENLEKTIDYGVVLQILDKKFSGKTIHLIETLLYEIAKVLLEKFSLLDNLTVSVEKSHMKPDLVKGARVILKENFKRTDVL